MPCPSYVWTKTRNAINGQGPASLQLSLVKTSFRKLHDKIKFMIERLDLFSSEDDLTC